MAPHSFLASWSIAKPTDDPVEKLRSAVNFCWLKKKPFSTSKTYVPGYFLSWRQPALLFLEIFKRKVLAMRRRASSRLRAVCVSLLTPCRWPAGSLCWWQLPSIQSFFHCNFRQKSKRSWSSAWKKRQVSFRAWAASKGMFVVLTAYTGSLGYDRYVEGWILKLFLTWLILEMLTDRPTKVCEKNAWFHEKLTCRKESFSEVGFFRDRVWFALWSNVISTIPGLRIWSTKNHYEFRGPVGPKACRRTTPGYAHGR